MTKQEQVQRRATEIYLNSKCTLDQAYEEAKREILLGDIPQPLRDVFLR